MLVGEQPGDREDLAGRPSSGESVNVEATAGRLSGPSETMRGPSTSTSAKAETYRALAAFGGLLAGASLP
jgi:hypothetical protein